LTAADKNNLQNLTVNFPLNRFSLSRALVSGKSTLIRECLLPALQSQLKTKNQTQNFIRPRIHPIRLRSGSVADWPHATLDSRHLRWVFDVIRPVCSRKFPKRGCAVIAEPIFFQQRAGRCPQCEGAGKSNSK